MGTAGKDGRRVRKRSIENYVREIQVIHNILFGREIRNFQKKELPGLSKGEAQGGGIKNWRAGMTHSIEALVWFIGNQTTKNFKITFVMVAREDC